MKSNYSLFRILSGIAFTILLFTFYSCKKESVKPVDNTPPKDTTLKVTSLSNTTLHYGDTLTINGNNFSTTTTNNSVTINGISATVQSATATVLKVIVPAVGATNGELKVKTGNQTATGGNIA